MQALKVLVIAMGVLLIGGIVALGFAVNYRMNHPRPVVAGAGVVGVGAGAGSSLPLPNAIDLPAGARVVGAEASGDRVVVRVGLGDGGEELIILNLATGALLSTVVLKAQPTGSPSGTP